MWHVDRIFWMSYIVGDKHVVISLSLSLSLSLSIVHSIHQSDVPLVLAVSAANCSSIDVSAYLNYTHMKMVLGKQFI